ncbi:chemotaxis protein CheX [Campylobacter sp.]|uniref:chemotaxis protein CheX n=1 Tax=Campylobacter sp. TaxID=205 RepID=UPI0026FE5543|nr:chemotaxis protein CheX [Campylobacter sp.]
MKPKFKESVVIFSPHGFLDGDESKYEIEAIDKELILSRKFECILISLKKVIYFNKRGLNSIIQNVSELAKKIDANVAFCDYDEAKFKAVKSMSASNLNFSLFQTQEIAMLFFKGAKKDIKNKKILLFHDNQEQKNQIALRLAERGYEVRVAKEIGEFRKLYDEYDIKIHLVHINLSERNLTIKVRENVIIYRLTGFIDSNFAENFDMTAHTNSLKVGFRFFVFDAAKARSTNIHGVSFLAKLSTASAEYGATIAVCGLSKSNTSQTLKNDLEDSGILLYNCVEDFFNDEGTIQGGAGMLEVKPHNITKSLIKLLPLVLKTSMETISSIAKVNIERGEVGIKPFGFTKEALTACIAFYGDMHGRILLCLDKKTAQKICSLLMQDEDEESLHEAYASLMVIIANKLLSWFESKNLKVELTMPNIFSDYIGHGDIVSKGAFIELKVDGTDGALFLSR